MQVCSACAHACPTRPDAPRGGAGGLRSHVPHGTRQERHAFELDAWRDEMQAKPFKPKFSPELIKERKVRRGSPATAASGPPVADWLCTPAADGKGAGRAAQVRGRNPRAKARRRNGESLPQGCALLPWRRSADVRVSLVLLGAQEAAETKVQLDAYNGKLGKLEERLLQKQDAELTALVKRIQASLAGSTVLGWGWVGGSSQQRVTRGWQGGRKEHKRVRRLELER
jgi:hypothetical protein